MSDKDKIKDLFSSKLSNFEVQVPDSVWGGIEKSLSSQPISTAEKPNLTWIRIIAVAACLIVALVSVYILLPDKEITGKEIVITDHPKAEQKVEDSYTNNRQTIDKQPKIIAEAVGNKQPVVHYRPQIKQSLTISNRDYSDTSNINNPTKEDAEDVVSTINQASDIEDDKNVSNEIPAKTNKNKWAGDYLYPSKGHSNNAFVSDFSRNKKSEGKGFNLAINSNALLLSSDISQRGGVMSFSQKTSLSNHQSAPRILSSSEAAVLYDKDNNYDLDHKHPVTFGLTVSKDITSRLSVETGITYTYLSSTIKSKDSQNVIGEKQMFHYLGIPINLNYTFLQLGSAKFYVSLGGAIQKDVSGKYEGVLEQLKSPFVTIISQSESNIDRKVDMKISQDHPQLSAHLNVGAAYPIYKGLNVYGSVGGAYYFDADNEYRTIYSDKDTQLDINFGLKWSF